MRPAARAAAAAALIAADRLTKLWASRWLKPRFSVRVLPFFSVTYVENTGAAFGIGVRRNGFFIALSAGLLGLFAYLMKKWSGKNAWLRAGLLLVAAGALGNLYDRVAYGYVVDFLDFRVWPVFNVADSCVTVGAFCLGWGMWREDRQEAARA